MEQKIAYFHIPKCMGTSLADVFIQEYGKENVLSPATVYNYMHTSHEILSKYQVFAGHITRDCLAFLPKDLRLLTVFRNPGRRILSLYSYYRSFREEPKAAVVSAGAASRLSFHDWLDSGIPHVTVETSNAMVRYFVPGRFFIGDRPAIPQNILAAAIDFLEGFEFIGFQEHKSFVADYINGFLKLDQPTLPVSNASQSEKIEYDPVRLRDFLHNNCRLDMELILHARSLMTLPKKAPYSYKSVYENDKALFEFFD